MQHWKDFALAAFCFGLNLAATGCSESPSENKDTTPVIVEAELKPQSKDAHVLNLKQIDTPALQDRFAIPDFTTLRDEFIQSDEHPPPVDILVIVDNSGSMSEEQTKLAEKMQPLLSALHHTDWRLNVISTDSPCPTREGLPYTPETEDIDQKFYDAIKIGIFGSPSEQGIWMAIQNLQSTGGACTKKWTRDEAKLAIIFLTDEEEDSKHLASELIQLLEKKNYKLGTTVRAYGILWHPDKFCSTAYSEGTKYIEVIEQTGGIWGDICANDYTDMLEDMSQDISHLLHTEIKLSALPIKQSMVIELNGQPFEGVWALIDDTFVLGEPLPAGSILTISYKIDAVRKVYLSKNAAADGIKVSVDSVEMSKNSYIYLAKEQAIAFYKMLPENSEVLVEYHENISLPREFEVPELGDLELICYLDEKEIAFRHFPEENVIVFGDAPPAGSEILCLY